MLLSDQQKYIISVLKQVKYIRLRQLYSLTVQHYRKGQFEISQHRMDVMLRQLRTGTNFVYFQEDVVCYGKRTVDERYLEAVDVMLELTYCEPEFFSCERLEPPRLLRFTGQTRKLSFLHTVAWMDTPYRIMAIQRMKGERLIWISDRSNGYGIELPHHHILAVRQEDGTHRFFGSQEPEKISQCTQDGASVELEAVTDDGSTAIWVEVNKTDKKSSVYLYETGDRSLLGEVDSAYSSTCPAFSADGAILAVGNTSASTLWFQKSGGEVVKAKLGGTLSSAALYTKDGRLDESTGDADGLYALVKASDSSSAYFITLDGDREKIVSDIRAFQIANGKICYLTTDKDLYLADIDGAQATDAVKLAGEVVDFDIAADGETVYYVKNFEEKEKSASLYRYSVAQGEAEKLSSDAYTLGLWGLYYSYYSLSSDGKTVFFFEQMQSIGDTYSTSGVLKCAAVGSEPVQVSTDIMVSLESGLLNGSIDPKHVMLEKYISLDEEKNILVNWMYFDGTQAQALAKEIYHSYTGKTVFADPPAQEDAE